MAWGKKQINIFCDKVKLETWRQERYNQIRDTEGVVAENSTNSVKQNRGWGQAQQRPNFSAQGANQQLTRLRCSVATENS